MIGLDSPWVLLLSLPVAMAVPAWYRRVNERPPVHRLRHPALGHPGADSRRPPGRHWLVFLLVFSLASLIVALARPVWIGEATSTGSPARSIMLLVDASPSMARKDFRNAEGASVSRMEAMREGLLAFLDAHPEDRFSLMVVTDSAGTVVPETADHEVLRFWIEQLEPGIGGSATALGDGLAAAMKAVAERRERGRVPPRLLVWTDGVNTGGEMSPAEALAVARAENIELFTVNLAPEDVGATDGDPTLEDLARLSGGQAIDAADREALLGVAEAVDRHEATPGADRTRRERHSLLAVFLSLGLVALVGAQWLNWRTQA
jgi:Ca-activated chloride channel family protein